MVELILGGARSGKSALAEETARQWCAQNPSHRVIYVATAEIHDEEMAQRIAHHRARRPPEWGLVEAPHALDQTLLAYSTPDTLLLVDCLTLWLSQWVCAVVPADQDDALVGTEGASIEAARSALLGALRRVPGPVLLVSNEVGSGIVPMGALSRLFADEQGRLNQHVAALADRVTLVVAGLPLVLKG